ncbi:MAG: DUF3794 domain-containing protein [Thermoanaerobacteraceae bacterium]|nr:DUF3794 domain-containing protein [Thermoanaerobacteraceae bacterium]
MSNLDVVKRLLKVQNVIGENAVQDTVENEIEFPVQVKKIWDTDAEIRAVTTKPMEDRVIVEGTIHKQIYFVAAEDTIADDGVEYQEGEVYELSIDETFAVSVPIPGTTKASQVFADVRIEAIDYDDIVDPQQDDPAVLPDVWKQTVVLEVFAKATETVQMEVVVDVTSPDKELDVIKELLKVQSVVGEDETQATVEHDLTFPRNVKKIKDVDAKVINVSAEVGQNNVIVEGTLHKQIFYVEQDTNRVYEMSVDETFRTVVSIAGAEPGMNADAMAEVVNVSIDLTSDTTAKQQAVLSVFAKVTEDLQIEVVTDVIGEGIEVDKDLLRVESVVGENEDQATVKNDIFFDVPVKKIVETTDTVKINRMTSRIAEDKVVLEGDLHKQIFYVDLCTDAVLEQSVDETFTAVIKVPGAMPGMSFDAKARVEDFLYDAPDYPDNVCELEEFNPEDFPWKQTAIVAVFVKVTEAVQLDVVVDVFETGVQPTVAPTECPPGTTITFVTIKAGDTLFKIAKKHNTTVEALLELNPDVDPKNLQIGQQIKVCSIVGPKG